MRHGGKFPKHEASIAQEPVNISEQGLIEVNGVELNLDLKRSDACEDAFAPAQNIEFGPLRVELEEIDGKTKLTLRHEGMPADMAAGAETGWNESFDKLAASLQ